jgi:hypothetical protein
VSRTLPIALPGGRHAELDADVAARAPKRGAPWKEEVVDALAGAVSIDGRRLDRDGVLDLTLPEFHTLRFFVERRDASREPEEYVCRNCDAAFEVDPYGLLPEGHFRARLGSERIPGEREFDLPEPLRTRSGEATTVTLRKVTVREATALREAIAGPRGWDVTTPVVRAMGIVALGTDRHPKRIARALARAPDRVWNAVAAAFDEMAYPAGLVAPAFCEACEARNDLVLPPDRELAVEPDAPASEGPFPDADAFAERVERIGQEVFDARGVRGLVLVADAGTPPCDQGGEPLLGSYQVLPPSDADLRPQTTFEVALFWQSFKKMWEEDGAYDLDAEIEETIDHEVEHHLGHLAGRDEQDEDEVEEIRRELVETYGRKALAAGLVADFVRDLGRFARTFWPLLLLAAAIVVAGVCVTR